MQQHFLKFVFFFLFTDRSTTKGKTFDPCWNEIFIHEVNNAKNIGLTVFHDAAIPPDDFVANCTIPFEDLAHRDKEQQDFWVSWLHHFLSPFHCIQPLTGTRRESYFRMYAENNGYISNGNHSNLNRDEIDTHSICT